jgi:hypothetical protein
MFLIDGYTNDLDQIKCKKLLIVSECLTVKVKYEDFILCKYDFIALLKFNH